ncbi:integrase core domain-containing protein, partial [Shewanella sp. Isolate13]
ITSDDLDNQLSEWQHYYNWERPHSAHKGKTPMEKYFDIANETPFSDEVMSNYDIKNERVQDANYKLDLEIARLKLCL